MQATWVRAVGYVVVGLLGALSACAPKASPVEASTPSAPPPMTAGVSRAPSFGQGAEITPEPSKPILPWRHRATNAPSTPEIEYSPALAVPADNGAGSELLFVETKDTSAGAVQMTPDMPPEPPPTGASSLVRTLYQLQAQVYSLRLLIADPRVKAQFLSRVGDAEQTGDQLAIACQDNPDCATGSREVTDSLAALKAAADNHDDNAVKQTLSQLVAQLARLRAALAHE